MKIQPILILIWFAFVWVVGDTLAQQNPPSLVNNYNDRDQEKPSELTYLSNANSILFAATHPWYGWELWKRDMTTNTTQIVKDINVGTEASNPSGLTAHNGNVYFRAYSPSEGYELWKTDGTTTNTVLVKDIGAGSNGSAPYSLKSYNSWLYFIANAIELWRTDGTAANTTLVKALTPTTSVQQNMYVANNKLIFIDYNYSNSAINIWASDGTNAGTGIIYTFPMNSSSYGFTEINGMLYFTAKAPADTYYSLWKTDGTTAGTVKIFGQIGFSPNSLTSFNSYIYFSSNGLWRTDGTTAGTTQILYNYVFGLKNANNALYFSNELNGFANVYKSDGTVGGTTLLKSEKTHTVGQASPYGFTATANGTVYFNLNTRQHGSELWKTDGTPSGTILVKDITAGLISSNPDKFLPIGNSIYFTASEPTPYGYELYKSDGTAATTMSLSVTGSIPFDSNPQNFAKLGNNFFFSAPYSYNSYADNKLFVFDASSPAGYGISELPAFYPSNYLAYNNKLYFSGGNPDAELWVTAGTAASTVRVADISLGANGSFPTNLTPLNATKFVFKASGSSGSELWGFDETTNAAFLVKDINTTGASNSFPSSLKQFGNLVYFTADDGINGRELWKTDGTAAGTNMVVNGNGANSAFDISAEIANVNGFIYFPAAVDALGTELYSISVKTLGTFFRLIKDINTLGNSNPRKIVAGVGNQFFFVANNNATNAELWVSDGSNAGTFMLDEIYPSPSVGSDPDNLFFHNGILYFSANNATNGVELWRSDGTPAGTYLLKDINRGAASSSPSNFYATPNGIYFSATDAKHGRELWKTDGTAAGTVLAYNIADDFDNEVNSSNPTHQMFVGYHLLFVADDKVSGRELYYYTPCKSASETYYSSWKHGRSATAHTTNSISSAATINYGRDVNYFSANSVLLQPGFNVSAQDAYSIKGNVFRAEVRGCY